MKLTEQQLLEKLRKFHDEMSHDDSHLDHANRTTEIMLDFFKDINYFENQEKVGKWDIISGLFPDVDWTVIEYIAIKDMKHKDVFIHKVTEHIGKGVKK